jgi:hypothetical protein
VSSRSEASRLAKSESLTRLEVRTGVEEACAEGMIVDSQVPQPIGAPLIRCIAERLHAELERSSAGKSEARVPPVALQTVLQLVKDATRLRPGNPYLERIAATEPARALSDVLLTLALVQAGLTCGEQPERERWGLTERLSGVRSPLVSALAGLGVGLSLPFLVDVEPTLSASLVASGSAAVIAREAAAVAGRERTEERHIQDDASAAGEGEQPRPGRVRRAIGAMGAALPTIATGAITSGAGSFLGDLLKGLIG